MLPTPRGDLHVTAPVLFGRMYIAPILGHFLDAHPLVNAHTMFVDRVVNMMDEGMDIAVRIGNLPDSSLSAVKVGSIQVLSQVESEGTTYFTSAPAVTSSSVVGSISTVVFGSPGVGRST